MSNAPAVQSTPAANPPVPIRTSRMNTKSIIKGKQAGPVRIIVHGVDGVGKSTFAAAAPKPVFLGTEDGTDHLDVARFSTPETWNDLLEAIQALTVNPDGYETLALDSADWAEPMIWRAVCQREGVNSIEEVGGGFGKGYTAALDLWRILLSALERLQRTQGMNVILIAHSFIKAFKNPEGDDFDRYILKLNEKAAALLREWSKGVYFANYETFAQKDKAKRVRGVSTGARYLYTQRTAAYDAKDRYGLPEKISLSWSAFEEGRKKAAPADPVALLEEINRKIIGLDSAEKEKVTAALGRAGVKDGAGGDPLKLSQLNDYVNAKVAEKAEEK